MCTCLVFWPNTGWLRKMSEKALVSRIPHMAELTTARVPVILCSAKVRNPSSYALTVRYPAMINIDNKNEKYLKSYLYLPNLRKS